VSAGWRRWLWLCVCVGWLAGLACNMACMHRIVFGIEVPRDACDEMSG
jgi:hypothetical protein